MDWIPEKQTFYKVLNCIWAAFWLTLGLPVTFLILYLTNPNRGRKDD